MLREQISTDLANNSHKNLSRMHRKYFSTPNIQIQIEFKRKDLFSSLIQYFK